MADEIGSNILDPDIFGRFGGEEFALFLPECNPEMAGIRAEKICKMVLKLIIPIQLKDIDTNRKSSSKANQTVSTTISIGIANSTPQAVEDFDTLMKYADLALYKAKNNGRNQVMIWDNNEK